MRKRFLLLIVVFVSSVVFTGCGKNEPIYGVGMYPPQQYPYSPYGPNGGNAPYPNTYPPGYSGPYSPGQYPPGYGTPFNPGMPTGFPQSYYPYLPMHPYLQNSGVWGQWMNTCQNYGLNPYDFQTFWYEFCPYACDPGVQQFYSEYYYPWYDGYLPSSSSQNFWQHYEGFPSYCGDYCY